MTGAECLTCEDDCGLGLLDDANELAAAFLRRWRRDLIASTRLSAAGHELVLPVGGLGCTCGVLIAG